LVTRQDYLRYDEQRGALSGIVQALLITRHMLFVGFGLKDDNFHRIVDPERRAADRGDHAQPRILGTALLVGDQPLVQELWRDELSVVSLSDQQKQAARDFEVLLDDLAIETNLSTNHLLDPS